MKIRFDRSLIEKCQTNAPRYTSYPTADRFGLDFDKYNIINSLKHRFVSDTKVSLYVHIPFCNTLCLYCACNKIITNDRTKITKYLNYLEKEVQLYANQIGKKLQVVQLHFGGGSPSWLKPFELSKIMDILRRYFNLQGAKEVSMELDPRHTSMDMIQALKDNGFNRVSIGLQDFDPKVQKAVNRVQTFEESLFVLDSARKLGFNSTNVDLIYGLPHQSLESFTRTIDQVIQMSPERIALFNYAHIPNAFMPQTRIKDEDLPSPQTKLDILQMSVKKLLDDGYVFIGMDHFAKPTDELAIAFNNGTLQRNFQGYSTFAGTDMLSFGVSSIGFIDNCYYQNVKDLDSYYRFLDNLDFPIMRGLKLSFDDIIRKSVISDVMCKFSLSFGNVSDEFGVDAKAYFTNEILKLNELERLGLIVLTTDGFNVTDMGRFLIRNVAVVFDKYLQLDKNTKRYSKVI